jgi:hypothetical protein
MIDVKRRFTVPEVPDVWVFPAGERDVTGFYAYPAAPRVARDDRGAPEANLVVYGSKVAGGAFAPRGAVLTLTTTLDLTPEETAHLRSALSRKVAAQAGGGAPPAAMLLSPDVVAADVEVRLADGVVLTGAAATTGGSRCSFNIKLDAAQTRSLRAAWDRGLPDARATYRLRLRPGPSAATVELHQATWSEQTGTQRTEGSTSDLTVSRDAATAGSLTLEGPLGPAGGLGASVTQVEL